MQQLAAASKSRDVICFPASGLLQPARQGFISWSAGFVPHVQGSRAGAKSRHAAKQPQDPPESTAKATPSAQQQPAAVTLSKAEKRRLARDQQHAASEQQERRAKRNMLLRYAA